MDRERWRSVCRGHSLWGRFWREMGVGGRSNIDPGNRWRDLDRIWHGGSLHPQEGYSLCGGRCRWAWVGVAIWIRATAGGIWTKFGMEVSLYPSSPHPQEGYRLCDYVVGVAGGRGMAVAILTRATAGGICTKFDLDFPHTPGKVIGYVMGVAGERGWPWQYLPVQCRVFSARQTGRQT